MVSIDRALGYRLGQTRWVLLLFALAAIAVCFFVPGTRQAKAASAEYESIDVAVEVQSDGSYHITETQVVDFAGGPFSNGRRTIPLSRIEGIENVVVSEIVDGALQPYTEVALDEIREGDRQFALTDWPTEFGIYWHFPETTDRERTFVVEYDVQGALRSYPEEVPPNQHVWWTAVGAELTEETPVRTASVSVTLPRSVPLSEVILGDGDTTIAGSTMLAQLQQYSDDGRVFRWERSAMGSGSDFTVRLQTPPIVADYTSPAWQSSDDAQRAAEQKSAERNALIHLLMGGLALGCVAAGSVGLYGLWYARGRDPHTGLVAEFLPEPPDDLSAGVVGTLIDERADAHDSVATVLDFARRGIVRLTEIDRTSAGGREPAFELVDPEPQLTAPEQTLLRAIFGEVRTKGQIVRLSEAGPRVTQVQAEVQEQLDAELVRHGYFATSPRRTRRRWRNAGIAIAVIAVGGGIFGVWGLDWWVLIPVVAAVGLGLSTIRMSESMPRKTESGAEAAAKWLAFRRYLANISAYERLSESREIFERYLSYATAFGLEQSWVARFSAAGAPRPDWFDVGETVFPRSPGGQVIIWGGPPGSGGSSGGGGIEVPNVDIPDLQDVSDGAARGVQGGSSGAMGLLNVAGAIFEIASVFAGGSGGGSSGGGGGGFS